MSSRDVPPSSETLLHILGLLTSGLLSRLCWQVHTTTDIHCATTQKSEDLLYTAADSWNLTTLVAIYETPWRHILRRQQFSIPHHTRVSIERITLNVSFECAYV